MQLKAQYTIGVSKTINGCPKWPIWRDLVLYGQFGVSCFCGVIHNCFTFKITEQTKNEIIMSLLKKLFGGKGRNYDLDRPDINALISLENPNNAIIALDNYVGKLCSYGDRLDLITGPQKSFYLNQNLEREVNNGGFNQYFLNSSGDYAHDTLASLMIINAYKTANILQKAIDQFPNSTVPKDRSERQNILEQINSTTMVRVLTNHFLIQLPPIVYEPFLTHAKTHRESQ